MQGYGTMALEAVEQLEGTGNRLDQLIYYTSRVDLSREYKVFANIYKVIVQSLPIVESNIADCLYKSAVAWRS